MALDHFSSIRSSLCAPREALSPASSIEKQMTKGITIPSTYYLANCATQLIKQNCEHHLLHTTSASPPNHPHWHRELPELGVQFADLRLTCVPCVVLAEPAAMLDTLRVFALVDHKISRLCFVMLFVLPTHFASRPSQWSPAQCSVAPRFPLPPLLVPCELFLT